MPDGRGPHPVAVVLHGGFWKAQYGRKLMWPLCRDLAARGWAAWNVEYRRGRRGGWPRTCEDVAAAVEHLPALTTTHLDLDRVVAVGHSAGGHLAAWLAGTNAQRTVRVRAACAQAGVVDLRAADRDPTCRPNVRRFCGGDPADTPGADPARLGLDVPVLCVHGDADRAVPLAVSEAYAAAQPTATVLPFAGVGHMEHLDPTHPIWIAAADWLGQAIRGTP